MYGCMPDYSSDGERAHEPWNQLSSSPTYRDVLGGEPYMLSYPVGRGWSPSPVCLRLHASRSSDEVGVCDSASPLTTPDECLCRRNPDLLLLTREQWWIRSCKYGDNLEAADTWLLIAYSAQGNCELHDVGLLLHRHLSTVSIAWLAHSVWPLDCGWKPDERLIVVPISVQNAFQNQAVNCGPLSETILVGMP